MPDPQLVFTELVLGLAQFVQEPERWTQGYPPGFIHALNTLAISLGTGFPKTITAFLALCHTPIEDWYPADLWPPQRKMAFNRMYALLQDGQLTEPTSDWLYEASEELRHSQNAKGYIPESVTENWLFRKFLDDVRAEEDRAEAQRCYSLVRSFLIEHSWTTTADFRRLRHEGLPEDIINRIKSEFYQPGVFRDQVYCCDRCGILTRNAAGRWVGVKPAWCDDHDPKADHVHPISATEYLRATRGIHLRTFIPGRTELALFEVADELLEACAGQLAEVVRYPGIDQYDLRLVFRDEVWAVDVKDLADPNALAKMLHLLPDTNGLTYDRGFYVVPDRRLELMPDYMARVKRTHGKVKPPLFLMSQRDFCDEMRRKCRDLVTSSGQRN